MKKRRAFSSFVCIRHKFCLLHFCFSSHSCVFRRQNTQNAVEQLFFQTRICNGPQIAFCVWCLWFCDLSKLYLLEPFYFVNVWLCAFFLLCPCFTFFLLHVWFSLLVASFTPQVNACPTRRPQIALIPTGSSLVWLSFGFFSLTFPFPFPFFLFLSTSLLFSPGDTAQAPKRDTLLPPKM